MKQLLKSIWPAPGPIRSLLLSLVVYSILVLICTIVLGFACDPAHPPTEAHLALADLNGTVPEYRTYFMKPNWFLYPLFFLLIGIIIKFSWEPFQEAWRRSGSSPNSVVKSSDGTVIDKQRIENLIAKLEKLRSRSLVVGLALALIWATVDSSETRRIYFGVETYADQLQYALKDPDFTVKWLFEREPPKAESAPALAAPTEQIIFTLMLELEQFFLIGLGLLVLIQIVLQAILFVALDKFRLNGVTYSIHLDPLRPSNDFGLGDWNKALDVMYWSIAPGLGIANISMLSQPSDIKDIGQLMGMWTLGLLLAAPFLITVLGRRGWVYECQRRLEEDGNDKRVWERFHQQRLWPMEARRMEKVGILLCMILFLTYAGLGTAGYIIKNVPPFSN